MPYAQNERRDFGGNQGWFHVSDSGIRESVNKNRHEKYKSKGDGYSVSFCVLYGQLAFICWPGLQITDQCSLLYSIPAQFAIEIGAVLKNRQKKRSWLLRNGYVGGAYGIRTRDPHTASVFLCFSKLLVICGKYVFSLILTSVTFVASHDFCRFLYHYCPNIVLGAFRFIVKNRRNSAFSKRGIVLGDIDLVLCCDF